MTTGWLRGFSRFEKSFLQVFPGSQNSSVQVFPGLGYDLSGAQCELGTGLLQCGDMSRERRRCG